MNKCFIVSLLAMTERVILLWCADVVHLDARPAKAQFIHGRGTGGRALS